MKKIILYVVIIFVLASSAGIFYLNEVILPTKIQSSVVKEIEDFTRKKVLLQAIRFNIFKGLVLKGLVIYDDTSIIVNAKEVSCSILPIPFFKKQFIIPAVIVDTPAILLERRADNSFNIADLFAAPVSKHKNEFNVIVHKVVLKNGNVKFNDYTLSPPFKKEINRLDAYLYLSLPNKVRFDASFEIPSGPSAAVDLSGEYVIPEKVLTAKAAVKGFSLKEFSRYYEAINIAIPEGTIDCLANMRYKEDIFDLNLTGSSGGLLIIKDKISAKLDSDIKYSFRYDFKDKHFTNSGSLAMRNLAISGIEGAGTIDGIKGDLGFDDSRLWSENLRAAVFGIPIEAKMNMVKLANPLLDIYITAAIKLQTLQAVLKNKFKIAPPIYLTGNGKLHLALQYKIPISGLPDVKGTLDVVNASIGIDKDKPAAGGISGEIQFTRNQLKWDNLSLKYLDTGYRTSGELTNFETPGVQMELSSSNIALKAVFALSDKIFRFSKLSGHYFDSEFSLTGDLDISKTSKVYADMRGTLDVDLNDVKKQMKKNKEKLDKMKLGGIIHAELGLKGDPRYPKACAIEAKFLSTTISIYGLKPLDFIMDYSQNNGMGDIKRLHLFLYGGTLDATGSIDLASEEPSYSLNADIQGIRIEKLKADTALKDKDIAGAIRANLKLDGVSDDLSRLKGSGKLAISDGKLWQLNLFRGLGVLLFTSDFSNIVFKDGYCNFTVSDNIISSDDIALKSDLLNMYGSARVNFNASVSASLKTEFTDEAIESGTAKQLTTAIQKYSVIGITGTWKEPKYTIRPDVGGMIEGIKDIWFSGQ